MTASKIRWASAILAALGAGTMPLACAHDDEPEAPKAQDAPETSIQVPDATTADAADAAETSLPGPGDCASSGLCIADATVNSFVNLTSVWGSSKSDVWAVGTNGTVMHYDGKTWETSSLSTDETTLYTLRSVWLERPDDVWAVDGNRIRHSTGWKGPVDTSWESYEFPISELTPAAIRGKGNTVWLARGMSGPGDGSPLVAFGGWSSDGPSSVDRVGDDYSFCLLALTMGGPDEVWGTGVNANIGGPSRVVRATRAPETDPPSPTWQLEEHDSRASKQIFGTWANDEVVWLVGEGGTLRREAKSAVATKIFEVVETPFTADLYGVFGFGTNDIWAVGEAATVLHWDGNAWSQMTTPYDDAPAKPRLLSVWGSAKGDVWISGHGTMLHFTENAP